MIVNSEGVITRTTYINERKEEGKQFQILIVGDSIAKSIPILA